MAEELWVLEGGAYDWAINTYLLYSPRSGTISCDVFVVGEMPWLQIQSENPVGKSSRKIQSENPVGRSSWAGKRVLFVA